MEPITLATMTAAVTVLATEAAKSLAGEAGKSLWEEIKGRLGFTSDPKPDDLAVEVALKLDGDEAAAKDVLKLLKGGKANGGTPLVGRIDAEKVIVQRIGSVRGDLNINM